VIALQPEFISTLRVIRDVYYPEITTMSAQVTADVAIVSNTKDQMEVMYDDAVIRSDEWRTISVTDTATLAVNPDGTSVDATATFNNNTGGFDFGIPVGANGIVGPQGSTGTMGSTGPTGATGAQGAQGVAGIGMTILGSDSIENILIKSPSVAGDSWLSLNSGFDDDGIPVSADDVINATGSKWINVGKIKGIDGEQGPEGPTGQMGVQGIDGAQGGSGPAGPAGAKGDTGSKGDKGDKGDTGDDAVLPSNLAYTDIHNTFNVEQTFRGTVDATGYSVLAKNIDLNGLPLSGVSEFKNIIMNPRFAINQRGVSNASASVGSYGADRWIKGSASVIHQRIEDGMYTPNATYTYSENDLYVSTLVAPASGTWQINTSIGCAYCQLELGETTTRTYFRPVQLELLLCQRYFWKYLPANIGFGAHAGSVKWKREIQFPTNMYRTPTISKSLGGASLYGVYEPVIDEPNTQRATMWTVSTSSTVDAYCNFTGSNFVDFDAEVT